MIATRRGGGKARPQNTSRSVPDAPGADARVSIDLRKKHEGLSPPKTSPDRPDKAYCVPAGTEARSTAGERDPSAAGF